MVPTLATNVVGTNTGGATTGTNTAATALPAVPTGGTDIGAALTQLKGAIEALVQALGGSAALGGGPGQTTQTPPDPKAGGCGCGMPGCGGDVAQDPGQTPGQTDAGGKGDKAEGDKGDKGGKGDVGQDDKADKHGKKHKKNGHDNGNHNGDRNRHDGHGNDDTRTDQRGGGGGGGGGGADNDGGGGGGGGGADNDGGGNGGNGGDGNGGSGANGGVDAHFTGTRTEVQQVGGKNTERQDDDTYGSYKVTYEDGKVVKRERLPGRLLS
jgi:hypothetical protein